MDNNNTIDANEIIRKRDRLTQAAIILKKEFFGIDSVIDQIIESVSSWYFFPNLQERPVVVNLWGMTGVGKSNLLERLVQLLNLNDQYFHFDMSEIANGQFSLNTEFSRTYEAMNNNPVIFTFDEFQLARSLDEDTKENNQGKTRIVWDLIDSGKYKFIDYSFQIGYLHEFLNKAHFLVRNGVKVKNGIVVQGKKLFQQEFNSDSESLLEQKKTFLNKRIFFKKPKALQNLKHNEGKLFFIDNDILDIVFELYSDKIPRLIELRNLVHQFNEVQTVEFIKKVINHALCPKVIDLSKSLFFVVGNLDEAYRMSDNFNPDIDADSFYQDTKQIGISEIKTALKKRFRKEQISRLGNTHIIYPSLNSNAFRDIILKELQKIELQWRNEIGIELSFDSSVVDMLYSESVFPTQGARPVLSSINQMVRSKTGYVLTEISGIKIDGPYKLEWAYCNKHYDLKIIQNKSVLHSINLKVDLRLNEKRKAQKDDLQSIVAVHESGHAIISSVLLNIIPDKVVSSTASDQTLGFNYTANRSKIFFKKDLINWIALHLGGIVSEELIFGPERISSGSGEDIRKATEFASQMIKYSGMYKVPIGVHVESIETNLLYFDSDGEFNQHLISLVQQGKQKAMDTLQENMELLIIMANYLSDETLLTKEEIKKMVEQYAKSNLPVHSFSYRALLKSKFQKVDSYNNLEENQTFVEHISLNKNTET